MNAIIDSLNACGTAFASFALPMLAQSAILIGLLWALDLTLRRRIRATIRYAFWLLVLVKLAVPPSLALPTGAGYWLTSTRHQSAPPIENFMAPPIISEVAPFPTTTIVNTPNFVMPAVHSTLTIQGLLFIVWLAVAAGIGIWVVWRLGVVLGVLGQSVEASAAVQSLADSCRRELGIRRAIPVRCASIGSPAICGLLRPVVLISPALANELSEAEMRAVLLHELAHYKRGDLWVNHAQILLQIVYWYNPLVWLANATIRRVREQAVDEMVLVEMGESRAYPATLLRVAKMSSGPLAPALGFLGILEPGRGLPERLRRIVDLPLPRTAWIGARGLATVLLLGLLAIPMACRQLSDTDVSARAAGGATDMEKFKAFMESPPVISKVVYSHYYPGRTEKYPPDYIFARWETNAFFNLICKNQQDASDVFPKRSDWTGRIVCHFDDKYWTQSVLKPGHPRILHESSWDRKVNPDEESHRIAIGVSGELDQFSFLMNMGVEHARIGAIRWTGNSFNYTNQQSDAAGSREWRLSGRLLPDGEGRAKELDLDLVLVQPGKPAPDTYQWAIDYSYESPRPISYLPSRIITRWVGVDRGGPRDHILDEFKITDLEIVDHPLSQDLFDPPQWHADQVHDTAVRVTNSNGPAATAYREDWSNKNLVGPVNFPRMSADEAREWEFTLERNPEDFDARRHLLAHYFGYDGSNERREAHEKHALWVIEHHPEVLGGSTYLSLNPVIDGAAYEKGKALWLRHVEQNPKNAAILGHAAEYFQIYDQKLAVDLLERAEALDPNNHAWTEALGQLYYRQGDGTNSAAKALAEFEKDRNPGGGHPFETLNMLAKTAFASGDVKKASSYATELLKRAKENPNSWNYGNAIQDGNLILGEVALSEGKIEQAKQYLLESGKTPGSPQLNSFGPNMSLANALLEKGETNTVLEYFDECRKFWTMASNRKKLDTWATMVKAGLTPDFGANLLY